MALAERWRFFSVPLFGLLLALSITNTLPLVAAAGVFWIHGILWIVDEYLTVRALGQRQLKATNALLDQVVFAAFLYYIALKLGLSQSQYTVVVSLFALAIVMAFTFRLFPVGGNDSPTRKHGKVWFYGGIAILFGTIAVIGTKIALNPGYSLESGSNAGATLLFCLLEVVLLLIGAVLAKFEKPVTTTKSIPFNTDIVFSVIMNKFSLGPSRAGLSYLIVIAIPLFAWSQRTGTLLPVGQRSGLINFTSGVVGYFVVVPVVIGLTVYLFQLLGESFVQDESTAIPEPSRKIMLAWIAKEGPRKETRVILAILTCVAVAGARFLTVKDAGWYWMEDHPHHVAFWRLLAFEGMCAWLGFFIVGSAISDGLIVLRLLRELGNQPLSLNPFHSDNRWGISKFGQCPLIISLVNSFALIVPVLLWADVKRLTLTRPSKLAVGLVLPLCISSYLAVLLFACVGSVWPLYKQLKEKRANLQQACSTILVHRLEPRGDTQIKEESGESVLFLYQEIRKRPIWPYGVRGIIRFLSAYGLTLLGLTGIGAKLSKILPDILAKLGK